MNTKIEITPIQEKTIQLLVAGSSVAAAARELNIDRTTIYTWRKNSPAFSLALQSARKLQTESIADSLQDLASTAVETLRDLLVSNEVPPAVRLRAALAVLKTSNQQPAPEIIPEPPPELQTSTEFDTFDNEYEVPATPTVRVIEKIGRNQSCPCGSGQKYKRCCSHFNAVAQSQAA
jgi:transposase-like protein